MKKKVCAINLDMDSISMLEVLSIQTGLAKSALIRLLVKTAYQSKDKLLGVDYANASAQSAQ